MFSVLPGEVFGQPEGFLGTRKLGTLILRGGKMGLFLRVGILRALPEGVTREGVTRERPRAQSLKQTFHSFAHSPPASLPEWTPRWTCAKDFSSWTSPHRNTPVPAPHRHWLPACPWALTTENLSFPFSTGDRHRFP